jgi:CheY-like chemotaxis protein
MLGFNSQTEVWREMDIIILHVEDDPAIAKLVDAAFASFGFGGTILPAEGVGIALKLLCERSREREPIDLILVDMQLPDGTGLDVVREVKSDPFWHLTPVLVLSGEMEPGVINEAYALGANCYLPKAAKSVMQSLKALYGCWVESALLPHAPADSADRVEKALSRAIRLRARTSEFFLRLADGTPGCPEDMSFWLECSLSEGNLSNLLAFFLHKIRDEDVPSGAVDRLGNMQDRVEKVLKAAENHLRMTGALESREAYRWALDLAEEVDEEIFAESLGYLFPKSPAATLALRERAASHFRQMGAYLRKRAEEPDLQRRADALLERAEQMGSGTFKPGRSSGAGQRMGR